MIQPFHIPTEQEGNMPAGVILINVALVAYTTAVWWPRKSFRRIHVLWFLAGFTADLVGTWMMYQMRGEIWPLTVHGALGLYALMVMGLHAVWAVTTCLNGTSKAACYFHRFSRLAYACWLAAFLTGAIVATRHHSYRRAVRASTTIGRSPIVFY